MRCHRLSLMKSPALSTRVSATSRNQLLLPPPLYRSARIAVFSASSSRMLKSAVIWYCSRCPTMSRAFPSSHIVYIRSSARLRMEMSGSCRCCTHCGWYCLMASSVSGPVSFVRYSSPRYTMLGSFMVMNLPKVATDLLSRVLSGRSSMVDSATASNSTACSALFLFTFFTMSVPVRIWWITCVSARKYSGSSGVGKYCSTRMHFTCSHGEGSA
mmetsp:Transcript_31118/g.77433  ORF Transcript_31118/g.77433 Transcript_31118/m.77433 type:complete len:214 (-) Transcript_31118:198-839(-)